jgi:hypothetical protein
MASVCKDCKKIQKRRLVQLHKEVPPPTGICQLCSKTAKLVLDHDHETGKFRGWLCNSCNVGLGNLGDNMAGLIRAMTYLNGSSTSATLASERLPESD